MTSTAKQKFRKAIPFLAVVLIGGVIIAALILLKPTPEEQKVEIPVRIVRVVSVLPADRQADVISQGTVEPRVEITLQPEVAGRVVEVSPQFVSGGFFSEGDLLLKIDPRDYELNVIKAEARVAEARQYYAREKAESEQAKKEWAELGSGEASPLVLREPQLKDAQAKLKSARASLDEARLNLERSEIRAPFDGRIRSRSVDVGQVVSPGVRVAEIYAIDRVEIRLPLTDRQVALLDLPLRRPGANSGPMPEVELSAMFAGEIHRWDARIVRTEGALDTTSRVLYAVAEVVDPYGEDAVSGRPPLSIGLFVEARIEGKTYEQVMEIPREAVRHDGNILVVDADNRIHIRPAEVVQTTSEHAIVRLTIDKTDRICISPLETVTENMSVGVIDDLSKNETNLAAEVRG